MGVTLCDADSDNRSDHKGIFNAMMEQFNFFVCFKKVYIYVCMHNIHT